MQKKNLYPKGAIKPEFACFWGKTGWGLETGDWGLGTGDWGLGKERRREEEFTTEGNSEFHGGHGGIQEKNEKVKEKKVKLLQSYFFLSSFIFLRVLRETPNSPPW